MDDIYFPKRPSDIIKFGLTDTDTAVPGDDIPSMITIQERFALSAFAAEIFSFGCRRDAVIVDAGTFLGASTVALAHGLSRSVLSEAERQERIWSYDLFQTTPGMTVVDQYLGGKGVAPGDSFRSIFDEHTRSVRNYLRVYEGDIRRAPAPSSIALLFLDILWSPDITVDVAQRFYPALEANKSLLIHQDFVYPYLPWVIIHMGLLSDYLPVAYNVPFSSMVFNVQKRIASSAIPDPREVRYDKAEAIYRRFVDIVPDWGKGALWLGFALYSASVQKFDEAFSAITAVEEKFSKVELVTQFFPAIKNYCRTAAESGTPPPIRVGV